MDELKTCKYQKEINELLRMRKQLLGPQGCSVQSQDRNSWKAGCLSLAIYALNQIGRAEPENKPLTLEELRQMDCDWVWIERIGKCGELPKSVLKYINGYGYVLAKHQKIKICDICLLFEDYGKTWFAYARKPENNSICEENENFIQNKFGYCFYILDDHPLIYNLYVHPKYRRRGHSRTLLRLAIGEIRKSGYEGEIRIQAKPREDSIGLADLIKYYQSMGLVIYEAHKPEQEEK